MNFIPQNLPELVWIFITAVSLLILARSIKLRIARSQVKYVNEEGIEIPKGLQELQLPNPVPWSTLVSNQKRNPPDWLKTQTPETIRLQRRLDNTLIGANIGIISGMIVAVWLSPDKDQTAYTIIPGILLGIFNGIFLSIIYDLKLPKGRKVIVGAMIGSSTAVVMLVIPLSLLSKLLSLGVGAIVGAMLVWSVSKQISGSRSSA